MFEAEGTIAASLEYPTYFSPDQLLNGTALEEDDDDSELGLISGDYFSGTMSVNSAVIDDQDWGIWYMAGGGDYQMQNPPPDKDNWKADMGNFEQDEWGYSCWIGHISGDSWQEGELSGTVNGRHFYVDYPDPYSPEDLDAELGSIWGDIVGVYDDAGGWQALSTGVYTEGMLVEPLWFAASFDGNFGYYDVESGEMVYSENNNIFGLLGGTGSPFTASPLTIMGDFNNPGNYTLWTNGADIIIRTDGEARLLGEIGGIVGSLKALFYAFYIRPNPDVAEAYLAGYVKSTDITGSFYPEIDMFEADGSLTNPLERETTVTPDQLHDENPGFSYEASSSGFISGEALLGTLSLESAGIEDQTWGLWRGACGGSYQSLPGDGWQADIGGKSVNGETGQTVSYWMGSMSGDARGNNELFGAVTGISLSPDTLGTFQGDFLGTYNEDGAEKNWQALTAGEFVDQDELISSGDIRLLVEGYANTGILPEDFVNNIAWNNLIGTAEGGQFNIPSGGEIVEESLSGVMLNIGLQNWGIFHLTANGTYQEPASDDWQILDLTGFTTTADNSYVGGSWLGGIAGTKWSSNTLEGRINTIWIQLHRNGTLSGGTTSGVVDGTYVDVVGEEGTWQAASAGEWVEVNELLDLTNYNGVDDVIGLGGVDVPV
ncbi:MAG: hypothetical protein JRI96_18400, partial [Deltaproteobacteria bacterium]|nr:hypothetical protein [Deltaproteobacteria bacterium]